MSFPLFLHSFPQEDSEELLAIYNTTFISKWDSERWNEFFSNDARLPLFHALKINDRYIGFAFGRLSAKDPSRMILVTLLVTPPYQGKGHSTHLVEAFLTSAFSIPTVETVALFFRDSKAEQLERLYAHLGFHNHSIFGTYSNGEKKHTMEITRADFEKNNS